jgi:hypothetical protein
VAVDPAFRNLDPELLKNPRVQEQLRAFLEAKRANPLQGYFPHGKQRPFHRSQLDVKLFVGGNRSGKSTAGVVDDLIQAVDKEYLPAHLQPYKKWEPPFFCRVVTPDFAKTLQAVTEVIRKWCPKAQMLGGSWEKAWSQQEKVFRLANGSFIECMTYEQDLDKFGGTARHRIHYDEEPDGEKGELIRQECVTRLIDYNGDELFTFTPLSGLSWIFDGLWEERGKEVESQVWVSGSMIAVQADMDDNPSLDEDGKRKALAAYPEKVREARKRGDFTHFKGLVYEEFDHARHVAKQRPTPEHVKSLDTLVAIDPGIRTTAVVFLGFDNDNVALLYDELYLHDKAAIPENVAQAIRATLKKWRTSSDWNYIDPSARNRNLVTGENLESAYQRAGISVIPGNNEVENGIFEVKRRLESNPVGPGRLPRLREVALGVSPLPLR